jgi:hypothetical protein
VLHFQDFKKCASFSGFQEMCFIFRISRNVLHFHFQVSPLATSVHLNNSHLHLMVHWAGQDNPVVFCLGKDQVRLSQGLPRKVYICVKVAYHCPEVD